jgi:hypothetical protein
LIKLKRNYQKFLFDLTTKDTRKAQSTQDKYLLYLQGFANLAGKPKLIKNPKPFRKLAPDSSGNPL